MSAQAFIRAIDTNASVPSIDAFERATSTNNSPPDNTRAGSIGRALEALGHRLAISCRGSRLVRRDF